MRRVTASNNLKYMRHWWHPLLLPLARFFMGKYKVECFTCPNGIYEVKINLSLDENSPVYKEFTYFDKPSLEEVKCDITGIFNDLIVAANKHFYWEGIVVELTNKFAAKIREIRDDKTIEFPFTYETPHGKISFNTREDFETFFEAAVAHVEKSINAGIENKKLIDFSECEKMFS